MPEVDGRREWRNARGALQFRYKQGPVLPSKAALTRVLKASLGPRARIWDSGEPGPERFKVGLDGCPGRTVLARGPNVHVAMMALLGTFAREEEPKPAEVSAPQSSDSGT